MREDGVEPEVELDLPVDPAHEDARHDKVVLGDGQEGVEVLGRVDLGPVGVGVGRADGGHGLEDLARALEVARGECEELLRRVVLAGVVVDLQELPTIIYLSFKNSLIKALLHFSL